MASETDIRIARAVALKAAVDMHIAAGTTSTDPRLLADIYVTWLLDIAASDGGSREREAPTPLPDDPPTSPPTQHAEPPLASPPADVPYGEEERSESGFHGAPSKPPSTVAGHPFCSGCGTEQELQEGVKNGKAWSIWRCPEQKKTREAGPERDEQSRLHPDVWPSELQS